MDKDLIDHLGIYKARTLPRRAYHYCVSTRAAEELERWPTVDVIDGIWGGVRVQSNTRRNDGGSYFFTQSLQTFREPDDGEPQNTQ